MSQSIGQNFLTYPEQIILPFLREQSRFSVHGQFRSDRTVGSHLSEQFIEREAEAVFFESLWANRPNTPAWLRNAFASQLAGTFEVARVLRRLALAHCFPSR